MKEKNNIGPRGRGSKTQQLNREGPGPTTRLHPGKSRETKPVVLLMQEGEQTQANRSMHLNGKVPRNPNPGKKVFEQIAATLETGQH